MSRATAGSAGGNMIVARQNPVVMEEVLNTHEISQARARRAQFDRNWAWFAQRAAEVYRTHRGKIICVSGEELFAGATTAEVIAAARASHPTDDGRFTLIIPQEPMERIYAAQG